MKKETRIAQFVLTITALAGLGCASSSIAEHGTLSEMTAVGDADLCEHEVPSEVCTRCHPELELEFQAAGDWCGPHELPESQCHTCHPDLDFSPLPPLPDGADVRELTEEEALSGLEAHIAAGSVTVFDFDAPWCAPCRNLNAHLRLRLAEDPDLAVRRVSVASWEGPVFERYLADQPGLPFVIVYDRRGRRVAALSQFDLAELDALLDALLDDEDES